MYEHNGCFPDLCILSHQLDAQALIFPVDPYYKLAGVGECSWLIPSAETVSFGNLSTR
jgi:hypothetical protein